MRREQVADERAIADVAVDERQPRVGDLGKRSRVARVGQLIQDDDLCLRLFGEECAHVIEADEARTSGDDKATHPRYVARLRRRVRAPHATAAVRCRAHARATYLAPSWWGVSLALGTRPS